MVRRLTAILAADVVGYSGLMAEDEDGILSALQAFRRSCFDPIVEAHHGRIVKLMGDGALVEFASVIDAVRGAIAIQTARMDTADRQIRLRIGVNMGDIITDGDDIYGDGVNVAARLEAIAEPDGICISGIVQESLTNRVEAHFADAGEHQLKNIERPVRVFRWQPDGASVQVPGQTPGRKTDKPSIAVLAFDNMSGDREQEYFSDGIAEDIITALSQFKEFFVIARNTSFTFKGQPIRVDQVCRELGVRYLLEGSVRKAGSRVRVTAQLIDGETGAHLWAAKYDRNLDDIFAVQDEITAAIVSAVAPETLGAELKRARATRPENLTAWDKVLQARWHLGHFAQDHNAQARRLLAEATEAAPELSDAYAAQALCDIYDMLHLWVDDAGTAIAAAGKAARRAVQLDDQNASAYGMLGMTECFARNFEEAHDCLDRAIRLNPNLAIGHGNYAPLYGVEGKPDEAKASARRAIELSPHDPLRPFWMGGVGIAAFVIGDYEACIENARRELRAYPGYASLMRQETAALGILGQTEEAAASLQRLLEKVPGLTVSQVRGMVPIRYPDDHERWLEGLRRAGLPD